MKKCLEKRLRFNSFKKIIFQIIILKYFIIIKNFYQILYGESSNFINNLLLNMHFFIASTTFIKFMMQIIKNTL